jgi:hypothetical protein
MTVYSNNCSNKNKTVWSYHYALGHLSWSETKTMRSIE